MSAFDSMTVEQQLDWRRFMQGYAQAIRHHAKKFPNSRPPIIWNNKIHRWQWINREQRRKQKDVIKMKKSVKGIKL